MSAVAGFGMLTVVVWLIGAGIMLCLLIAPLMIWRRLSQLNGLVNVIIQRGFPAPDGAHISALPQSEEEQIGTCPKCNTKFLITDSTNIRCPVCRAVLEE